MRKKGVKYVGFLILIVSIIILAVGSTVQDLRNNAALAPIGTFSVGAPDYATASYGDLPISTQVNTLDLGNGNSFHQVNAFTGVGSEGGIIAEEDLVSRSNYIVQLETEPTIAITNVFDAEIAQKMKVQSDIPLAPGQGAAIQNEIAILKTQKANAITTRKEAIRVESEEIRQKLTKSISTIKGKTQTPENLFGTNGKPIREYSTLISGFVVQDLTEQEAKDLQAEQLGLGDAHPDYKEHKKKQKSSSKKHHMKKSKKKIHEVNED